MMSGARCRAASGLNLRVTDVAPAETFLRLVLGANTVDADEDFAAIELLGSVLMLHADHSYLDHEMAGVTVWHRGARRRASRSASTAPIRTASKSEGEGDTAMPCWPAASTSRTGCASVMSSDRTATSSCQAGRLSGDFGAGNRILTI